MRISLIGMILTAVALAGCNEKGSAPMPFEPESQRQVQTILATYLRHTLAAMPPGTVIDAGRFAGAGHNSPCDDAPSDAQMRFHTIGELRTPGNSTGLQALAAAGEVWRRWGWRVVERPEFRAPNRFGYSPDGYRIQITAAAGASPIVQASSPCFPRLIARDDIAFPMIITSG
jgi:hypothetical protein